MEAHVQMRKIEELILRLYRVSLPVYGINFIVSLPLQRFCLTGVFIARLLCSGIRTNSVYRGPCCVQGQVAIRRFFKCYQVLHVLILKYYLHPAILHKRTGDI